MQLSEPLSKLYMWIFFHITVIILENDEEKLNTYRYSYEKFKLLFSGKHSHPKVFLDLKICYKFTGEHPCRSAISINCFATLQITLWHGCCLVNLLHVFRTALHINTSGWLLLSLTRTCYRFFAVKKFLEI